MILQHKSNAKAIEGKSNNKDFIERNISKIHDYYKVFSKILNQHLLEIT